MASQNPINDNGAQNKSLLTSDGETDTETRRIHSRTRGTVNAVSVEIVDASGNQITNFGGSTGLTDTQLRATPVPILGTVTANLGTIADVATQTTLALIKAKTDNIPPLGQALEAASTPVVLPATQITTLTPPAAITGFATSVKQLPDNHQVTVSNIASVPLITGFATEITLAAINAKFVSGTDIGDVTINNAAGAGVYVQPGTSTIWDVADRAARLVGVVYGSQGMQLQQKITSNDLIITLDGESVAVTGTFWQTTQPVSIASMPSTPVTGTFWQATQPVSGTVTANLSAGVSGGATPYKLISAATTNATSVKGSAGQIYAIQVYNINAAVRYLKLYDKATAPTVGTDVPVKVIAIPGSTTGAGSNFNINVGSAFTNGIALAITTGIADTDIGAVAANEIIVNIDYK